MQHLSLANGQTVMESLGLVKAATLNDTETELGTEAIGHEALSKGYNNRNILGYTGHTGIVSAHSRKRILQILSYNRDHGLLVPHESDLLFIDHDPESTLTDGTRETYTQSNVLRSRLDEISKIIPFIHSPAHLRLLRTLKHKASRSSLDTSERWNNKGIFMNIMQRSGALPIPYGKWVTNPDHLESTCEYLLNIFDEIIVKPGRGVAGIGAQRLTKGMNILTVLKNNPEISRCLHPYPPYYTENNPGVRVEVWEDSVIATPSVVLWISEKKYNDRILQISEQCMKSNISHEGNIWPIEGDWTCEFSLFLKKHLPTLQNLAHLYDLHGYLGIDFIIVKKNNKYRILAVEANYRYTGSLPGKFVAENNGIQKKSIYTGAIPLPRTYSPESFLNHIQKEHLGYNHKESDENIIPLNFVESDNHLNAQIMIIANSRLSLNDLMTHFSSSL